MRFDDSPMAWKGAACADRPPWWWFSLPWSPDETRRPAGAWPLSRAEALARERERAAARRAHQAALTTCTSCPLVAQCAQWGLTREMHGVWGGIAEWERAALGGVGRPLASKQPTADQALTVVADRFRDTPHAEEVHQVVLSVARRRVTDDRESA